MPLLGPFDRPLPLRARPTERTRERVDVPTVPPVRTEVGACVGSSRTAAIARYLTRALLGDVELVDESGDDLKAVLHDDVAVWSPSFFREGSAALIEALSDRDDALCHICVSVDHQLADDRLVFTEWRLTGIFDRAGFVDDDLLVEPSHRSVESSGIMVCGFDGERVRSVRCYYDELGVMERLFLGD